MPTYQYRCNACNEKTEVVQSITEEPLKYCLKCNGTINRIISSDISIQFKGSGFYCTENNN